MCVFFGNKDGPLHRVRTAEERIRVKLIVSFIPFIASSSRVLPRKGAFYELL